MLHENREKKREFHSLPHETLKNYIERNKINENPGFSTMGHQATGLKS